VIVGDFLQPPAELLSEMDQAYIFHLVSSCRPSPSTTQAANEVSRDLVSTINYLEHTKDKDVRWIFYLLAEPFMDKKMQDLFLSQYDGPISSYGLVKLSIERYFDLYRKSYGLDFIVIRLSNPYGPWQDPQRGQGIVAALIYKALTHQTIDIWGDGSIVRDIYITDAIEGILQGILGLSGDIFNVGTGIGTSIVELVEKISRSLDIPISVQHSAPRFVDVQSNVLDSRKLLSKTSWSASTNLDVGILSTATWMKNTFLQSHSSSADR
jgi:UDP-glucose 4-epimerase